MAPPKRASKRFAGSIEEDEDVTTPKKEKKTPAKKTPKVVQMQSGTPKTPTSPAAASPVSVKKSAKKTHPAASKTPNAVNTPSNLGTPKSGKMSEPSPLMTRSARKKKNELNATIGTPINKGATPKVMAGKKLNTPKPSGTPKAQTPSAKGKKNVKVEEEDDDDDDDDDLNLALDDDMDSDDVESDENDSDDDISSEPDEGVESEDEIEAEKRKAELEAILNKPGNRKSILKTQKVDSPAPKTPAEKEKAKTVAKKEATPVKATEVAVKSPAKPPTPKIANPSPKLSKASDFFDSEAVDDSMTPSKKGTKAKTANTPAKEAPATPAPAKTPVKEGKVEAKQTGAKTPVQNTKPAEKTPGKKGNTPVKTPAKGGKVEANQPEAKTPVEKTKPAEKTPGKKVATPAAKVATPAAKVATPAAKVATPAAKVATPAAKVVSKKEGKGENVFPKPKAELTEEDMVAIALRRKEKKKARAAKKAAKRAALVGAAKEGGSKEESTKKRDPVLYKMIQENLKQLPNMDHWTPAEKLNIANQERFNNIREKLRADGKTEEEIAVELPRITSSMLKRLSQTRCLRCRKFGHMQKDCPKPAAKVTVQCYKCGDKTHTVKNCSIKEEVYTYADCYLCHQKGHLTRTCPKNENGIYPRGGCCFFCKEKTHLAKNCPKRDENTDPKSTEEKAVVSVGLLNNKQSGDADPDHDSGTKKMGKMAGNKKKAVVKF